MKVHIVSDVELRRLIHEECMLMMKDCKSVTQASEEIGITPRAFRAYAHGLGITSFEEFYKISDINKIEERVRRCNSKV